MGAEKAKKAETEKAKKAEKAKAAEAEAKPAKKAKLAEAAEKAKTEKVLPACRRLQDARAVRAVSSEGTLCVPNGLRSASSLAALEPPASTLLAAQGPAQCAAPAAAVAPFLPISVLRAGYLMRYGTREYSLPCDYSPTDSNCWPKIPANAIRDL